MEAGARGCQIVISGKLTGQRHRVEKFKEGHIKFCGEPAIQWMEEGFAVAKKKLGVIGVKVQIMNPNAKLPDEVKIVVPEKPKEKEKTEEKLKASQKVLEKTKKIDKDKSEKKLKKEKPKPEPSGDKLKDKDDPEEPDKQKDNESVEKTKGTENKKKEEVKPNEPGKE